MRAAHRIRFDLQVTKSTPACRSSQHWEPWLLAWNSLSLQVAGHGLRQPDAVPVPSGDDSNHHHHCTATQQYPPFFMGFLSLGVKETNNLKF